MTTPRPIADPPRPPLPLLPSCRELAVRQLALRLAVDCNHVADRMPPAHRSGLGAQIRRAASPVPGRIAAGYRRAHRGDYLDHLSVARGSLGELETHLRVARHLRLLPEHEALALGRRCALVGRMLARLVATLMEQTERARRERRERDGRGGRGGEPFPLTRRPLRTYIPPARPTLAAGTWAGLDAGERWSDP